jgi:hypothetical protein
MSVNIYIISVPVIIHYTKFRFTPTLRAKCQDLVFVCLYLPFIARFVTGGSRFDLAGEQKKLQDIHGRLEA